MKNKILIFAVVALFLAPGFIYAQNAGEMTLISQNKTNAMIAPPSEKVKTPGYVQGEILVKFKEGADPEAALKASNIEPKEMGRVLPESAAGTKFKKEMKLEKQSDGYYWFLGKKYGEIGDISNKDAFQEAQKSMTEEERGLYRIYKIKLPAGLGVKDALGFLKGNPSIEYAQPNHIFRLMADTYPNDPYFKNTVEQSLKDSGYFPYADYLWGLKKIECAKAWSAVIAPYSASPWNVNLRPYNIVVAVIDSGVDYTHKDLSGSMWTNGVENRWPQPGKGNGIDDDGNGYIDDIYGYDFVNDTGDPMDDDVTATHGTHVAGIIAAVADNNIGMIGVAPPAKIMAVKAGSYLGCLDEDTVCNALKYAADNGARVINMSFGFDLAGLGTEAEKVFSAVTDACHYAYYDKGCVLVASAGNDGTDNVLDNCPADIPFVIAVSATGPNDELCDFSSYGPVVSVSAPGGSNTDDQQAAILSTCGKGLYETTILQKYVDAWRDYLNSLRSQTDSGLSADDIDSLMDYYVNQYINSKTGKVYSAETLRANNTLKRIILPDYLLKLDLSKEHFNSDNKPLVNFISDFKNSYLRLSGTSMSAPYVAGVAALLLSKYPNLSNDDVRRIIEANSDDLGKPGKDEQFGYGRVNAYKTVKMFHYLAPFIKYDTTLGSPTFGKYLIAKYLDGTVQIRGNVAVSDTPAPGDTFKLIYSSDKGSGEIPVSNNAAAVYNEQYTYYDPNDPGKGVYLNFRTLANWDTTKVQDGKYKITSEITTKDGKKSTFSREAIVDNNPDPIDLSILGLPDIVPVEVGKTVTYQISLRKLLPPLDNPERLKNLTVIATKNNPTINFQNFDLYGGMTDFTLNIMSRQICEPYTRNLTVTYCGKDYTKSILIQPYKVINGKKYGWPMITAVKPIKFDTDGRILEILVEGMGFGDQQGDSNLTLQLDRLDNPPTAGSWQWSIIKLEPQGAANPVQPPIKFWTDRAIKCTQPVYAHYTSAPATTLPAKILAYVKNPIAQSDNFYFSSQGVKQVAYTNMVWANEFQDQTKYPVGWKFVQGQYFYSRGDGWVWMDRDKIWIYSQDFIFKYPDSQYYYFKGAYFYFYGNGWAYIKEQ